MSLFVSLINLFDLREGDRFSYQGEIFTVFLKNTIQMIIQNEKTLGMEIHTINIRVVKL